MKPSKQTKSFTSIIIVSIYCVQSGFPSFLPRFFCWLNKLLPSSKPNCWLKRMAYRTRRRRWQPGNYRQPPGMTHRNSSSSRVCVRNLFQSCCSLPCTLYVAFIVLLGAEAQPAAVEPTNAHYNTTPPEESCSTTKIKFNIIFSLLAAKLWACARGWSGWSAAVQQSCCYCWCC